jgi:hypothetical protein
MRCFTEYNLDGAESQQFVEVHDEVHALTLRFISAKHLHGFQISAEVLRMAGRMFAS